MNKADTLKATEPASLICMFHQLHLICISRQLSPLITPHRVEISHERHRDGTKRIALAFCSFLLSFTLFALYGIIPTAIRYGPRHALPSIEIMPVYLLFAFPGVLLALPFVPLFKDAEGYRAWTILAIGTFIGPTFLGGWSLFASNGHFSWQADGAALVMALLIGFPTTVFYVVLLRRMQRKAMDRSRCRI